MKILKAMLLLTGTESMLWVSLAPLVQLTWHSSHAKLCEKSTRLLSFVVAQLARSMLRDVTAGFPIHWILWELYWDWKKMTYWLGERRSEECNKGVLLYH